MKQMVPTKSQEDYIKTLFRKGRTIAEVQALTKGAFTPGSLTHLKQTAGQA